MSNDFYGYLRRMKYIKRWSLMHSTLDENDMEHTMEVTVIAHALALIGNKKFNKSYDVNTVLTYALYHECSEVITGDLPTPVKYFNREINTAYKDLELLACKKLLASLDDDLKGEYEKYLLPDKESDEWKIVKFADRIAAYVKCIDEVNAGNKEFNKAHQSTAKDVNSIDSQEVKYFIENILPAFTKSLDELD